MFDAPKIFLQPSISYSSVRYSLFPSPLQLWRCLSIAAERKLSGRKFPIHHAFPALGPKTSPSSHRSRRTWTQHPCSHSSEGSRPPRVHMWGHSLSVCFKLRGFSLWHHELRVWGPGGRGEPLCWFTGITSSNCCYKPWAAVVTTEQLHSCCAGQDFFPLAYGEEPVVSDFAQCMCVHMGHLALHFNKEIGIEKERLAAKKIKEHVSCDPTNLAFTQRAQNPLTLLQNLWHLGEQPHIFIICAHCLLSSF